MIGNKALGGAAVVAADEGELTDASQMIAGGKGSLADEIKKSMPIMFRETNEYMGDADFYAGFVPVVETMARRANEIATLLQNLSLAIDDAKGKLFGADNGAQKVIAVGPSGIGR
ncbi:MAG: hypothetical protein LBS91_07210 [Clostridiales Family XIII bacterium]|jgi:hypothetical protein|nr:hypothetical protein [Clostridiales Family XIII bacterium]